MMCALRFSGGAVRFTNRFVMTHKLLRGTALPTKL